MTPEEKMADYRFPHLSRKVISAMAIDAGAFKTTTELTDQIKAHVDAHGELTFTPAEIAEMGADHFFHLQQHAAFLKAQPEPQPLTVEEKDQIRKQRRKENRDGRLIHWLARRLRAEGRWESW